MKRADDVAEIRIAHCVFILAATASLNSALAQEVPTAGSQLQTVRPPPVQAGDVSDILVERKDETPSPTNGVKVLVNSLRIAGANKFSETELIAASGFTPRSELTLAELRSVAAKISDYYHRHGYFLAQATLPPQDVVDGAVTIAVSEGRYGNVVVRNQSRLNDDVANNLLEGIETGDTVGIEPLESRLLLLSDLPGVSVKSTLTPGGSVGASDLIVEITANRLLSGDVEADNFGSRYTGEYRFGGLLNVNTPFGRGDVASLRSLTSADGFGYGRAAYQLQFSRTTVGAAYTVLDYELGEEFKSLEAHGTAKIASVYARYPLIRLRRNNLSLVGSIDSKRFRDELDVTSPTTVTRKQADVAMISLLGDRKDAVGGGGVNSYSLTWTSGHLELKDALAAGAVSSAARASGHYDKFGLSFQRLQRVTSSFSFYGSLQAQWTSNLLDVSERLGLGGATSVRAYPEGEGYADKGYIATAEGRIALPKWSSSLPGQFQLTVFADSATGYVKDVGVKKDRRTLSGAGIGVNWFDDRNFSLRTSFAHRMGSARATSAPDSSHRFWFNAVKYF